MPKPKQFLKEKPKKSKHAPHIPTNADEFLAAGVDFEEAGEKWRGGDAAKSTRFFVRAIDCYTEGLQKFPNSFDLAYNKARVQYELTQHPKLLRELPGTLLDLLKVALESSRNALRLNSEDPDTLFNTAQILTSLVDTANEEGLMIQSPDQPSILLQEALELFAKCLKLQEAAYADFENQLRATQNEPSDDATDLTIASQTNAPQDSQCRDENQVQEQWATIVTPVSKSTILDTILAQLETMTTLFGFLRNGPLIHSIMEYAQPLITEKLPYYVIESGQDLAAAIALASYTSAEADARYRLTTIDMQSYGVAVHQAWKGVPLLSQASHVEGLCARAEAYINCSNSLRLSDNGNSPDCSKLRWQLLTSANKDLTTASTFKDDDNIVKIHLKKGDVELWRYQLGQPPRDFEVATKNQATLLKNAEKHYRGAGNLATVAVTYDNEGAQAKVKEAITKALGGNANAWLEAQAQVKEAGEIMDEALEEGLVVWDQLPQGNDQDSMVE